MNKASGGDGIPAELFQNLKDDAVKSVALSMPANLENSEVATGVKKGQFLLQSQRREIPKNAKTTICTIAITSHASTIMLKIL